MFHSNVTIPNGWNTQLDQAPQPATEKVTHRGRMAISFWHPSPYSFIKHQPNVVVKVIPTETRPANLCAFCVAGTYFYAITERSKRFDFGKTGEVCSGTSGPACTGIRLQRQGKHQGHKKVLQQVPGSVASTRPKCILHSVDISHTWASGNSHYV